MILRGKALITAPSIFLLGGSVHMFDDQHSDHPSRAGLLSGSNNVLSDKTCRIKFHKKNNKFGHWSVGKINQI